MKERPTGIIRTLPSLDGDKSIGAKRYARSMGMLERGTLDAIYIALPTQPLVEVLYMYLLLDGQINVRLHIAGYEPGSAKKCWDSKIRRPNIWAICVPPVERPPAPLVRRGFQGFRYCQDLW